MPTISNLRDRCKYRVWRKVNFTDDYVLDPTLRIDPAYGVTEAVAPEISACMLSRPAGYIKEHEATDFPGVERPFAAYAGQHVKVQSSVDDGTTWETLFVGFIEENTYRMERADFPSGGNRFQCFGYAALLDKRPVLVGRAHNLATSTRHDLEWLPDFNAKNAKRKIDVNLAGNRSANKYDGIYVFNKEAAEIWTNLDIAEYVIAIAKPAANFFPDIPLTGQHAALAGIQKFWEAGHTHSLWWWLCQVIDRRYGFGFVLKYTEGASAAAIGSIAIEVYTTTDVAMTVGTVTIPPNANQTTFSLDFPYPDNHEWNDLEFRRSYSEIYDRLVVRGERILMVSTFTPGIIGPWGYGSLWEVWPSTLLTAYKNASGTLNAQRNDMIRSQDIYEPMFSQFQPPTTWPYKALGLAGATYFLGYWSDENGDVTNSDEAAPWQVGLHCFERVLPLHAGKDYSVSPVVNYANADPPEFRPLFAFAKIEQGRQAGKYAIVDRLNEVEPEFRPAHVKPLDNIGMGLGISATPRHYWAKADWAGAKPTEHPPTFDWHSLRFTAAWRLDTRQFVAEDLVDDPDPTRVLVIDVKDAEYWKVAAETVVDVVDGAPKKIHVDETILRDDLKKLQGVLAAAKAWYEKDRHAVEFNLKTPKLHVPLGTMITAITGAQFGSEPVRAVVTKRTIRVTDGGASCKIETGWNNFDWANAWSET